MDFLPSLEGVKPIAHELVPDLGGFDFDNEGFLGYDERQGWNVEAVRKGDLFAARNDWSEHGQKAIRLIPRHGFLNCDFGGIQAVVGSFLQTWITFGILQEALNRPIFRAEVSRQTESMDSHLYVKHLTLRAVFKEFANIAEDLRTNSSRCSHLFRCLRVAASVLSDLDRAMFVGFRLIPTVVHRFLSVLVETLHEYTWHFCPRELHKTEEHIIVHNRMAQKSLSQRGWCPNLVERIASGFHSTGLYYASILPALDTPAKHDKCAALVCEAWNIDNTTYETQHVPEECLCRDGSCDHKASTCSCQIITVEESDLRPAFEGDGFPVIEVQKDGVRIVKYIPGVKYVALSHVWSDGRGNPRGNSLPACQIQSIYQYVTAFYPNQVSRFWIDTLCVPVTEPLRNTAIVRMAEVYSSASAVLVLSAEMLSLPSPYTIDELLLRLYCCKWSTRLWTRQEATLAKDIGFQFLDKAVRFSELVAGRNWQMTHLTTTDRSCVISILAESWLIGLFNLRSSLKTEPLDLGDFWRGLRYRSTSRSTDVAISGSILMGMDVKLILEASPDQKMQAFWSCQTRLPTGILWVSGPRLKAKGFSWAPSNLLDPLTTMVPPRTWPFMAELTPAGLLVDGVDAIHLQTFQGLAHDLDLYWFSMSSTKEKYFIFREYQVADKVQAINQVDGLLQRNTQFVLLLPELPRYDGGDGALIVLEDPLLDEAEESNLLDITASRLTVPARYHEKVHVYKDTGVFAQQTLAVVQDRHPDPTKVVALLGDQYVSPGGVSELELISPTRRWRIF